MLVTACNNYRKYIHTENPFPDRNSESLNEVHNILLEASAEFKDDGSELDNSKSDFLSISKIHKVTHDMIAVYNNNNAGMITYVYWLDFAQSKLHFWLIPCF